MTRQPDQDHPVVHFLLVEDNEADILLLKEALDESELAISIQVARDGEEALEILKQRQRFADAARPDLILLDMNLPRKNGFELLKEIKQDDLLLSIPVIVLSTSAAPFDINRSYQLHANCFISKPGRLEEYLDMVSSLTTFWLKTATLPQTQKNQVTSSF